ncbi:DUF4838 domain-containing protein [Paenibacillus ginsengarvi]|uniref:DUF4838 domain-containing protein n=1 Tax=Paenibacillus ginsengarvi TaxID=400777 RepID=UPI001960CAD0|nr:DUF4838 domain-containing protein [Paenibacillus ginsengarvi]
MWSGVTRSVQQTGSFCPLRLARSAAVERGQGIVRKSMEYNPTTKGEGQLKRAVWIVVGIFLLIGIGGAIALYVNWNERGRYLVYEGEARAVIVRQNGAIGKESIDELQARIRKATGVSLPIVEAEQVESLQLPETHVLILVGPGPMTEALGIRGSDFDKEAYRVAAIGDKLVLTGASNAAIFYATSYFLDEYLGVRYLWPGELGTYVPRCDTIALPAVDVTRRPEAEQRRLRASDTGPDTVRWMNAHMMGSRSQFAFGHAFTEWYEKYGKEHPDYFAQPPAGERQVLPERVKLDLSNEAVDEAIIREWRAAGTPDNWNVSPNDGSGFCVSAGCLAMDEPPGQSIEAIWRADGNLTARYVKFWNRLLGKMRAINPKVTLSTYAYSSYKEPPQGGLRLGEGMVIGFVHTFQAFDQWKGWSDAGAKLFLRPNWWHSGAIAPNLMLHATGDYFKFARQNGMIGFDFDSIMGYWGTQGLNYYLIARLSVRPELSVDDVIDEYASAFGKASSAIRDYIRYWERFSVETAYNVSAGNGATIDPAGRFEAVVKQYDLPSSPLNSGWYTLPYLYIDSVMQEAYAYLDRADKAASADEAEVLERIAFLREGLRHLELTREVVRYGYEKTRPAGATPEQFKRMSEELDNYRKQIASRQVIWYDALKASEKQRDIPTVPERTKGWNTSKPGGSSGAELDEAFRGL